MKKSVCYLQVTIFVWMSESIEGFDLKQSSERNRERNADMESCLSQSGMNWTLDDVLGSVVNEGIWIHPKRFGILVA